MYSVHLSYEIRRAKIFHFNQYTSIEEKNGVSYKDRAQNLGNAFLYIFHSPLQAGRKNKGPGAG